MVQEYFSVSILFLLSINLVWTKDFIHVVLLLGLISLMSALMYLQFGASDVCMTEVALNSAVSTCILLKFSQVLPNNLNLIGISQVKSRPRLGYGLFNYVFNGSFLIIALCFAFFVCLCCCLNDLAPYQSGVSNVHQQANLYYIENTAKDIGIESMVAAILASYRGYDTLNETLVIFIASISSCLLFNYSNEHKFHVSKLRKLDQDFNIYYDKKLLFALPLLILFILLIQFAGESSPGGGFQAGSMSCGYLILFYFIGSNLRIDAKSSYKKLIFMSAFGVMIYLLTGMLDLFEHSFLSYDAFDKIGGQAMGITLIELGVWFTVCFGLYLIFITCARCAPLR